MIRTFDDVEHALLPYVETARIRQGRETKLERTFELAKHMGNPQDKLKVIHVAGTSGKTSTSYFISAMLRVSGAKAGLTVSPHIDSVTERAQINGKPLDEETYCGYFSEYLGLVESVPVVPTYFELLMVFAFWVFARQKVDYAVIETGLGGLQDASNICRREDKVCIITDIGIDHVHVLGDSLKKIAVQKAGIIWPGNRVVMYNQAPDVMDEVQMRVRDQRGAVLQVIGDRHANEFIRSLPEFQKRNWKLAHAAYEFLQARDSLSDLKGKKLLATQNIRIPGRMDIEQVKNTTFVLDGAHNEQKMSTLLSSFIKRFPEQKPVVLISVKSDKDLDDMIGHLSKIADRAIATEFHFTQDIPLHATDPNVVKEKFKEAGFTKCAVELDLGNTMRGLVKENTPLVLVTGSFFLVAEVRAILKTLL